MRATLRLLVCFALAFLVVGSGAAPASADTTAARDLVERLQLRSESGSSTYDRNLFPHWIDADRDCQDTRAEVLQAESWVPVSFTSTRRCTVSTGRWYSYVDGATWTRASDVDIDHMVPLKEAWESGARNWTTDRRRSFANDLGHPATLVAITDNVNQSKGDRDPAAWLPPRLSARCEYAIQWAQVKYRWGLTVDGNEKNALKGITSGSCGARSVTVPAVVK